MRAEELAAGARTAAHVAGYFEELKQTATELAKRVPPQSRGYFTPQEEEETTALLISYWQARNALYDLITSFRRDEELTEEDRPAAFLVAYSAALVLIDAARFLREIAHRRPVVRQKLNQAVPEFDIPGGVYDTVQRSLFSARHAWHLYHAIQYFQQHELQLRSLAAKAELAPLMETIDRLGHRLDISLSQFARVKLRTRGGRLLRSITRDLLARALYGLQKLGGTIVADKYVARGHRPGLPPEIAAAVRSLLEPGDVLIVRKEFALTNYFLPGYWPHAALYLGDAAALEQLGILEHQQVRPRWKELLEAGDGEPHCVLESMKDGVRIRSLASPFASDSVLVLRPQIPPSELARAIAGALSHAGKRYDFDFDFRRSDRLVCTEVVYRAYDGIGPCRFELKWRAGRPTLSGCDLVHMALRRENFRSVAVYAPALTSELVKGDGVDRIVNSALCRNKGPATAAKSKK
jgi:hypothetical protein